MSNQVTLPSVEDGCKPREDILKGDFTLDLYAANLSLVVQDKGPDVYRDPELFFKNTFPTVGLKTTVQQVFTRLAEGKTGSPVIMLETGLGGGKTHTLIALYHLAKQGSSIKSAAEVIGGLDIKPVRVASVVGTEMPVSKKPSNDRNTLWGEIVYQLFGDEGFAEIKESDKDRLSPGERVLERIFGGKNENEKCLILIDELALYLARAAGVPIADTTLSENSVTFIQELSQFAASHNNVDLVITSLDPKGVFSGRTGMLKKLLKDAVKEDDARAKVQDAKSLLTRVVTGLKPTKGEEFSSIIKCRIFESIDTTIRDEVCSAYAQGCLKEGTRDFLSQTALEPNYLETLKKDYPFHPTLIDILRTKISSIENFNQTRGVLRFLSLLVKSIWDSGEKPPMIHPFHIDFNDEIVITELINRLGKDELISAISEDLANEDKKTRSEFVDDKFSQPLGTWATTTILLHTLTSIGGKDITKGATEPEVHLALYQPGMDLSTVEKALDELDAKWFYFGKEGAYFFCGVSPRLNKLIEEAKKNVQDTKVFEEIEKRIRTIFKGKTYVQTVLFANEPGKVADDTGIPKMVVLHFNDCTTIPRDSNPPAEVRRIYDETGSLKQSRVFINNLFFIVCEKENIDAMKVKAKELLALVRLLKDYNEGKSYLSGLSSLQHDELNRKREESELFLKVAVTIAYKHIFAPTVQAGLPDHQQKRPLRQLTLRDTEGDVETRIESSTSAEAAIVEFLRNSGAARTADDKPLAPEFILDNLWPKNNDAITGDEFKKMFYRKPKAGLHFSEELIRKSMQDGVRDAKWYAIDGAKLFDKDHAVQFQARFTSDLKLVIVDSDEGRRLKEQFTCPKCGKLKSECTCSAGGDGGDDGGKGKGGADVVCPRCGQPLGSCTCGKVATIFLGKYKMERLATELKPRIDEMKIETIDRITFYANGRNALSVLVSAFPQFGKMDVQFDLEGEIDRTSQNKGKLKIIFTGDPSGYQVIKSALHNYLPGEEFDDHTLRIIIGFKPPIEAARLVQILGEKVADFTQDNLYKLEVEPTKGD